MTVATNLETTSAPIGSYIENRAAGAAHEDDTCTKTCACPCSDPCAYVAKNLANRVFQTTIIDMTAEYKKLAEEDLKNGWDKPDRLTPHQIAIIGNPAPVCPVGKLSAAAIIQACADIRTWLAHWSALLPIIEGDDYNSTAAIRCHALEKTADAATTVVANSLTNSIEAIKAKAKLVDFMIEFEGYNDECLAELEASIRADVLALPAFNSPAPHMEGLRATA